MTAKEILQQYVQKQKEIKKYEVLKSQVGDQLKKAQREANRARTQLKPVELPLEYVLKELSNNKPNYVDCTLVLYVEHDHFRDPAILKNKKAPCYATVSIDVRHDRRAKPLIPLILTGKTIVTPSTLNVVYSDPIGRVGENQLKIKVVCEAPKDINVTFNTRQILDNKTLYDIVMNYDATKDNSLGE